MSNFKWSQLPIQFMFVIIKRDMEAALIHITKAVYSRFGKTGEGISSAFQRSLDAIGTFLYNRKRQVQVVLDEFQQISGYSTQDGEAIFRKWMQSFPGLRFIFSGSHRHMMVSMFSEKNRPFYRSTQ